MRNSDGSERVYQIRHTSASAVSHLFSQLSVNREETIMSTYIPFMSSLNSLNEFIKKPELINSVHPLYHTEVSARFAGK